MPEISCFYIHFNRFPREIIFIRFEKYFIVWICNYKKITLSYETFINIPKLFDMYVLSLLLTENTRESIKINEIYKSYNVQYWIRTKYLWKGIYFCNYYENVYVNHRNLLNKCEPMRETSNKKIKKFIKQLNRNYLLFNTKGFIEQYMYKINIELNDLQVMIFINNTISILTGIKKKYGKDIYEIIRSYLI